MLTYIVFGGALNSTHSRMLSTVTLILTDVIVILKLCFKTMLLKCLQNELLTTDRWSMISEILHMQNYEKY